MRRKLRVVQQRNGRRIAFLTPDKGKPGRTPKEDQWYQSNIDTGWQKDMPEDTRRALMLKAHGGDLRASAQALIALHNVTTDIKTKNEARKDVDYFFKLCRKRVGPDYKRISKNMIPLSAKRRPISPKPRPLR
jgi:hypothetical protein